MSTILAHPATVARELQQQRLYWMLEAARFTRREDRDNASWCKGKASGLNDAIVAMGGDPISLAVSEYMGAAETEQKQEQH